MSREDVSKALVAKLKEFGYRVFGNGTYGYFTDGKNIGYFEVTYFGYINLSSVHKPNRLTGTGFSVVRDVKIVDLNKSMCEDCFALVPSTYNKPTDNEIHSVVKWKDWNTFEIGYWHEINEL